MLFSIAVAACGGGSWGGTAPISATATTAAQNLTVGTAMTSFSPLTPSGGATPYTYSYTGTLPTGLSFSTSTGAVTGTPTATYATASLVFSVKDANNVAASTTSTVSFTVVPAASYNLAGVTANGVTLGGNLIAPVTVGSHTYYYWDVNGDGTASFNDAVYHDLSDQIFNGGTLGDSTKDTTDPFGNIVTLSNGLHIHLPTQAELLALYATQGTPAGWYAGYYEAATQVSPGVHVGVNLSNGMVGPGGDSGAPCGNPPCGALGNVAFEVY